MSKGERGAGRVRWRGPAIAAAAVAVAIGLAAAGWIAATSRSPDRGAGLAEIRALAASGRWAEAEAALDRRIEADPGDGQARVLLALILLQRRDSGGAIRVLQGVPGSDPERPRAAAMIGDLEQQARRAGAAERAFREAAERAPTAAEPRRRLIYLLSLEGRQAEARDRLWELFRIDRDPRILADLVRNLWAYEVDARAGGGELAAFLARTPADPFLRRAVGLDLLIRGESAAALPHLEAAAKAIENDPVGRFALAECRLAMGLGPGDESILGPRPAPPADAARWAVLRGRLREATGRDAEALASYREAVEANPRDPEAHYRLGQVLLRRGAAEAAGRHLDRSDALKAEHEALRKAVEEARRSKFARGAADFERLGNLCRDSGLIAEATAWFELATSADPTLASARSALAELAEAPPSLPVALSRPVRTSDATATVSGREPSPRPSADRLKLEDVAGDVGVTFRYDPAERGDLYLGDTMGGGVALLDYDEDGWLDIYFVNGCRLPHDPADPPGPNRLYRNRGDGTFEDATARAGVPGRGYGMGAAVGDYDGDGHEDLFLTGLGRTVLYRNRGDGTFEDATARAGVQSGRWTTAAGFADLDADGDLDLMVVTYVDADPDAVPDCRDATGRPLHCSPARFAAQADLLFRNDGDGTFTEVSKASGIAAAPEGRGLGLAIADFNDDGLLDLFVANDLSPDFLFLNRGGLAFEESAMTAGVALNGSGRATASMGTVADDLDGDGKTDLFITNFLNESNTFFRGLGGGLYADGTLGAGLYASSLSTTGFGVAAPDLDNDGVPDLFITNGHVDDQPWLNTPMAQPPQAFLGLGAGRFEQVDASAVPYLGRRVVGRGLAAGDLDNDGRVDLVIVHRDAPVSILRNRTPGGHWLGLRLKGPTGTTPIGARVTCRVGDRELVRVLSGGVGYLAVHDPRLWFGLGESSRVDQVRIRWPSGREQSIEGVPADQILDVRGDTATDR